MSSPQGALHLLRFGLFEIDLLAGELRKQGRRIKLQEQPFQVFALMLRRPGELVTREELRRALWAADTFVEFDQGLNTAVKKIRLALGDSADNPSFIETIPRKGYRFIAPVNSNAVPVAAPPSAQPRGGRRLWAAALFGLVVCIGVGVWSLRINEIPEPPPVPVPLTSYPGDEASPTFSPDGNQVAFVWNRTEEAVSHIYVKYVKLIGADEPTRLTHDENNDFAPAWSPDGRFIAFLRSLPDDRTGVFLIAAPGGPARKLAEVWSPHDVETPFLAWHPNGKWLVMMDKDIPDQPFALFLLSLETGEKRRITFPPSRSSLGDFGPAFSPDGRAVVFSRNTDRLYAADLFLQELSDDANLKSPLKQLTFGNPYTASPAWTPDGRAIVFSSGTSHSPTLYKMVLSRPGWRAGKPERLAFAGDGAREPAISRKWSLGYMRFTIDANIWRMQLNGGLPPPVPPARLIASTHLDHTPQYSPDGKRIAFVSTRSGSHEIWVCNSDGSGTVQLTSLRGSSAVSPPAGRRMAGRFFSAPLQQVAWSRSL